MKTVTASSQRKGSPSFAANTIPAKTSRFFDHWRGRSATSSARKRARGSGRATTSAGCGTVIRLRRLRREDELEPAAVAGRALELDPPAERDRELARDRQPQ